MNLANILKFVFCNAFLLCVFCLQGNCRDIEVGLLTNPAEVRIGSNKNAVLLNLFTNKEIGKVNIHNNLIVHNANGLISISIDKAENKLGAFTGPIKLMPKKL